MMKSEKDGFQNLIYITYREKCGSIIILIVIGYRQCMPQQ